MRPNRVALLDGRRQARADDGPARRSLGRAPLQLVRLDAVLVGVRYGASGEPRQEVAGAARRDLLVSITRDVYSTFSRSLSRSLFESVPVAGEVEGEMREECGDAVGASMAIIASAAACPLVAGVPLLCGALEGVFGGVSASTCVCPLVKRARSR